MKIQLGKNSIIPGGIISSSVGKLTPSLPQQIKSTGPKKKVLCWSDSVLASTGFGNVSRYILDALHKTGRYEIYQLAINHFQEFYDRKKVPYVITPARLANPGDPYGNQMFIETLKKYPFDLVFIINDTFVTHRVSEALPEIQAFRGSRNLPPIPIIYYYPIDCHLLSNYSGMVQAATRSVAYTHFAAIETKKTLGVDSTCPTDIIYHGADIKTFHPLSEQERQSHRQKIFQGKLSEDTFMWINVNRNSPRKDVARTLIAFKKFQEKVPNSFLYLHMLSKDVGAGAGWTIDLNVVINELGLKIGRDVGFPLNFSPATGFPPQILNILYNCADAFISTHLGEGWSLSVGDAKACCLPVVVPNNTVTPELVGPNGLRGYVYPCKEQTLIDGSGLRDVGHIDDIVDTMLTVYDDWKKRKSREDDRQKGIIERAHAFVELYSWDNVCRLWVQLFREVEDGITRPDTQSQFQGEVL